MKRFKKILYVNDGKTERGGALERAVNLARTSQAVLTVVEIQEDFPHDLMGQSATRDLLAVQKLGARECPERLENLIKPIKEEGVKATSKVLQGTHFLEIIREVLRNNHDLVMLSPRRKGRVRRMLFGSRTMHLMRKCPCPVWAIKPTKRKQYTRILAAVDPVPADDERNALNIKIMEIATSLAQAEGSELHIIHCWTAEMQKRLKSRSILSESEIDMIVREHRKAHKMWLDQLLGGFNLKALSHKTHLLKGETTELIADLARKKRVELVVMGTVCRTGLPGFFIGNTAERILQQMDCSVLALKPDGFVTPVRVDE